MIRKKKMLSLAALVCAALFPCCSRMLLPPLPQPDVMHRDTSVLRGKIIAIDPGHGGPERGAIGTNGLSEAEVNLGVALYLWGLLNDAGAEPLLTRTADTGVSGSEPFVLDEDLGARSNLSNAGNADLFISIHHNAAPGDSRRNDLTIFYKMTDRGRSRDLAMALRDALAEILDPAKSSVRPAHYHVLRSTDAPAVLGEASFMTNRQNEHKLFFHRTLAAEAYGYFKGILNYYYGGVPRITELSPRDVTVAGAYPRISALITPGADNASIDRSTVSLVLDASPRTGYSFSAGGRLTYTPRDALANGLHRVCVSARNTNRNVSGTHCADFQVDLPAAHVTVTPLYPVIPADGMSGSPVDITVTDALGRPVMDGTQIAVSASAGTVAAPSVVTRSGSARTRIIAGELPQAVTVTATCEGVAAAGSIRFGRPGHAQFMLTIRDRAGSPVEGALLLQDGIETGRSDSGGFAYDRTEASGPVAYTVQKKGYYPAFITPTLYPGKNTVENILLKQVDGGVLMDKTVVIDPAGATFSALPVVQSLFRMIETAGGNAVITWQRLPAPSPQRRVSLANGKKAVLFISIDITENELSAAHYYRSPAGKQLAAILCRVCEDSAFFADAPCSITTSSHPVIVHTAMPALRVCMPSKVMRNPDTAARCLYRAIVECMHERP